MQTVFTWLDAHPVAVYLFFGIVLAIAVVRPAWIARLLRPRMPAGESDHRPDEDDEQR